MLCGRLRIHTHYSGADVAAVSLGQRCTQISLLCGFMLSIVNESAWEVQDTSFAVSEYQSKVRCVERLDDRGGVSSNQKQNKQNQECCQRVLVHKNWGAYGARCVCVWVCVCVFGDMGAVFAPSHRSKIAGMQNMARRRSTVLPRQNGIRNIVHQARNAIEDEMLLPMAYCCKHQRHFNWQQPEPLPSPQHTAASAGPEECQDHIQ